MNKAQLLTTMGLLTLFGTAMIAAGLLNLSQLSDYTITQAWNALWEQHPLFAWVSTIYCFLMAAFDLWVIAGIFYLVPSKKIAHRS
jgi:hypothetical protein